MPTYARYKPSKTQLTLAGIKEQLAKCKDENRKLKAELGDAQYALKWVRDKLVEKEDENRNLKLIILRLTEQGEAKKNG